MSQWQLFDSDQDDDRIVNTVIDAFRDMYETFFKNELLVNHDLPIEIRAFRHTDMWRIFLLLTPWTLARIFLPEREPGIQMPKGWLASERINAPNTVIGPAIPLEILGGKEQAHLNYHLKVGHYFIQPLIQSMAQFKTPDDAFYAWNEVIKTRDKVIETQKKSCAWQ
ncbi:MAG: [NiFe]-hydrogenase assembly chaperone HybE, partial [Thiomargarita sp.]|nr:[NiFe]-hydrogenase assembly chaperone HybE [Thiomargarita sp.]